LHNRSHRGKLIAAVASAIPISLVIILLVCVFETSFVVSGNVGVASAIEQQGRIHGAGTSEAAGGVCSNFHTNDFLTIQFDASYLISPDGKTGKVTSGSGLLDTTYSNVFGQLTITGGTVDIGVHPVLYSLKGTATFQSLSSLCNLPSTAEFSIAKPDGTQLKCGNTDLITFNSVPMKGSVTGNVDCTGVGTTQTHPQSNIKTHTMPPENVNVISATDGQRKLISNDAVDVSSKSITFQLSRPTDDFGIASLECSIDGSTKACPLPSSGGPVVAYNNLNTGKHTFRFMAKDSEGNTSSDRFTWTISTNAKG
jgi:hypothetical protein